jgi:pilus assembly protein CpaC
LTGANERLELTTNTSRILTLDKNIPRVQVNNPDLLAVTPLSANQVQISAKKAGVTQVNLWDEDGQIYTVDILIYGDVKELEVALLTQFPNSSIKVYRYSESLVLKGFVDQPEHVSQIVQLSSDYAPKVINNITVGGVQQVLLKVRVMEISRTKLRSLGVDFSVLASNGSFFSSSVSGLIENTDVAGGIQTVTDTGGQTVEFAIFNGSNAFFGFLDALEQRNIAKVLAEPNIVAVSGRPAQFNVGGEIPIVVPQSLGTASIEFKKFGTQVDFLPIVLGNGNIRLEVRPRISEIDDSRSVIINEFNIPALTVREVDTAVEMKAGQTFALAGLVQERTESQFRGLPYVSDIPIIGVPFRKVEDEVNEIELLIVVTPEFVDAIDPHEVECGGPGYATTVPTNAGLYCGGHLEVPAHCNPIRGMTACGECSQGACGNGPNGPVDSIISDGMTLQGGTGYDESYSPTPLPPPDPSGPVMEPDTMTLPPSTEEAPLPPQASRQFQPMLPGRQAAIPSASAGEYTVPRPYSPARQPVFVRNASSPNIPNEVNEPAETGGLIGPVGYEAQ